MTPDPNSPRFIRHEVPEYACENSKKLSQLYLQLREQISIGKWKRIKAKDILLTYNTYDGTTEIKIKFLDENKHIHHFSMQLVPDNGFGNNEEDSFRFIYQFEGSFDENALSVRSFAEYLSIYLQYEGFDPQLFNCDKAISLTYSINYAYKGINKLIDTTLSHIKPLEWFYSKEPKISTFKDASIYLVGVMSRLQLEANNNRWDGVKPECFQLVKYVAEGEASLGLEYIVKDVWELHLCVYLADCGGNFDMCGSFSCYPNINLSAHIKSQLNALFANFLSILKVSQGNTFIGCGNVGDHSISIQYFYIDDTFEILCKMLDDIVPAIQKYEFQLALPSYTLSEKTIAIKKQLEAKLHTTFDVITEEQTINERLKHGHFKSYN